LIRQILPDTLKLSFPYWALEGFFSIKTLKFVDAIITQTYDQSAYLKKRGIYSTMIRNSIVINNNKYIKPNKKIVVWVANIKKMKNIEDFIKLSHFINEHLEFVCVGRLPGNSQYRATIENLIKTSQVQYKGELSYNETAELISRSYILVNTSYNEGFPNTFIQAWSFGVPVISLNIDPDKIIMQNKIGLFSGTFEKMVDDTLFLINNKEEWGKMSLNAYQFARSNFDIKENLKSYIKVFNSVI
jgi:glycosyltransferase involved in cell wall biosynthesis